MSFNKPNQGSRSKTMTNFTSLPHSITAAIGAILISTVFVGAAIGPSVAQTAETTASAQATA
jgi:hypothetical protein